MTSPMSASEFDRAVIDAATPEDVALCLTDIASLWQDADRRLSAIFDHLPPAMRTAIEDEPFFDGFSAYRSLIVHAATLRGFADAEKPASACPYRTWQTSEFKAWHAAWSSMQTAIDIGISGTGVSA